MWPLLSLTAFLEPEVRVECWVRTSVPAHPKGCCCGVYKGTTSPHTPSAPPRDAAVGFTKVLPLPTHQVHPQGMLLWGLQRYHLSPHTPHTPRDVAVGFTKVLPLPTHQVHPQGMLLWGLQRYYLSPHTKCIPKGCCCGVYKGTTSPHTPHTPQGMLLSGLQRYYLSPHTKCTPLQLLNVLPATLRMTANPEVYARMHSIPWTPKIPILMS